MRIEKINLYIVYYFKIKMSTSINFLLTVVYIKINFIVFVGNKRREMYDIKYRFNQWRNPKEEDDDDDDEEEETGKVVLNSRCCIAVFVVVFLKLNFDMRCLSDIQELGKRLSGHRGEMPKRIRGAEGKAVITRPTLRVSDVNNFLRCFL